MRQVTAPLVEGGFFYDGAGRASNQNLWHLRSSASHYLRSTTHAPVAGPVQDQDICS